MKQDIKEKWVAALRSGEYKQTKGFLYIPDQGYCCLGVLCKILGEEFVPDQQYSKAFANLIYGVRPYEGALFVESKVLPEHVREKAGMKSQAGVRNQGFDDYNLGAAPGNVKARSLTELNDAGYSFATIADMIEKYGEDL